jgi:hypothetical protein
MSLLFITNVYIHVYTYYILRNEMFLSPKLKSPLTSMCRYFSLWSQYIGRGVGIPFTNGKYDYLKKCREKNNIKFIDSSITEESNKNMLVISNPNGLIVWESPYDGFMVFANRFIVEYNNSKSHNDVLIDDINDYYDFDESKKILNIFLKNIGINPTDPIEKYLKESFETKRYVHTKTDYMWVTNPFHYFLWSNRKEFKTVEEYIMKYVVGMEHIMELKSISNKNNQYQVK